MKNKIIFCYCIISLSSYAAEDAFSFSDYSCDTKYSDSSSVASAQSTSIPLLDIASVQRTRSNSMPSPSPQRK